MAFSPTNEEIFKYFLKPLIEGRKDDYLSIIYKTNQLYGENVDIERTFERGLINHTQHVDGHGDDDYVWFFTKLKRLGGTSNKLRFDRAAGVGTWTSDSPARLVYEDKQESWRGNTRILVYNLNIANWIMHEFSMEKDGKQYSDYVIVKIKRLKDTPLRATRRRTDIPSSCSHGEILRATRRRTDISSCSHVTYQYQKLIPSPAPTQDAQQGEYKLDAEGSSDSLMAELKGSRIAAAQEHNQEELTTDSNSEMKEKEIIFSKF